MKYMVIKFHQKGILNIFRTPQNITPFIQTPHINSPPMVQSGNLSHQISGVLSGGQSVTSTAIKNKQLDVSMLFKKLQNLQKDGSPMSDATPTIPISKYPGSTVEQNSCRNNIPMTSAVNVPSSCSNIPEDEAVSFNSGKI